MPIAYAFPQGGGGGAPLPAPTFQPLGDLNGGGFTFSDPNSLVSSYSFAAGVHSFGLVTVNPAVGNYALNSAPNFTGPRWTQPLVDGTGAPVLAGDSFVLLTRFSGLNLGTSTGWAVFLGTASDAGSTVLTAMQPIGSWIGSTGIGTPNAGVHNVTLATTVSLAGAAAARSSTQFSGAPGKVTAGQVAIIGAASSSFTNRLGIAAINVSDLTQLSLAICPTTLGAITTVAGTLDVTIDYAVVRY